MLPLFALLLALPAAAQPQAECRSAFGQTACGYDCTAAFGQVRCASVPYGRCQAAFGKVVCGPEPVWGAPAHGWPQANCTSAFGQTACGYDCTAAFGQLACAATPWGACDAAFGRVTCTDGTFAPQRGMPRMGMAVPKAQCISAFGQTACGWGCVAELGQVVCAQSPWGACAIDANGRAVCSP